MHINRVINTIHIIEKHERNSIGNSIVIVLLKLKSREPHHDIEL